MSELAECSSSKEANIEKQLLELEILQSIYSNDNELIIEDEEALCDAREYLVRDTSKDDINSGNRTGRQIGFVIKFSTEVLKTDAAKKRQSNESDEFDEDDSNNYYQIPLEIVCRLPTFYPLKSPPVVFVRALSAHLNLDRKFTEALGAYIHEAHTGDCLIMSIIEWVKENAHRFLASDGGARAQRTTSASAHGLDDMSASASATSSSSSAAAAAAGTHNTIGSRLFIYSHHIYNIDKRRSIVQWAKELDLRGFCVPGKPGMICVEGVKANVQEFWTRLRSVPWQKLQIKDSVEFEIVNGNSSQFKFDTFEERCFSSTNGPHVDSGKLLEFLKLHGLNSVFIYYFGVEGKS